RWESRSSPDVFYCPDEIRVIKNVWLALGAYRNPVRGEERAEAERVSAEQTFFIARVKTQP
nr:hypothetical protein [Spirochaeta sp.]